MQTRVILLGVAFSLTVWPAPLLAQTWTQLLPATSPPVRTGHAMAEDTAHSGLVLFGGVAAGLGFASDTWTWTGMTWVQQAPAASPQGRFKHAMAYDSIR